MQRTFFTSLLLLSTAQIIFSQPDSLWTKFYGGSGRSDKCVEIIITHDGGFALAGAYDGRRENEDFPPDVFCLVKTDSTGEQEWLRYWNFEGRGTTAYSLVQTLDRGFLLVGWLGIIARADSTGELEWWREYENVTRFDMIKIITDSTFVVVGDGRLPEGTEDGVLFNIDITGEILWSRYYDRGSRDKLGGVELTPDGGFLLSGTTNQRDERGYDGLAIKTDAEGEVEWMNTYGIENGDFFNACVILNDGSFCFVGTHGTPRGDFDATYDVYVVRTDSDGEELWSRVIDLDAGHGTSVLATPDGGIIVAGWGSADFDNDQGVDYLLIRFDYDGELLWMKNFNAPSWSNHTAEQLYSLARTSDGGYALGGFTNADGPDGMHGDNIWLLKTEPDVLSWRALPDTSFVLGDTLSLDREWFDPFLIVPVQQDTVLAFEAESGELVEAFLDDSALYLTADLERGETGLDSVLLTVMEADNEDNSHSTYLRVTVREPNSVDAESAPPAAFLLDPAFPNPFNASTRIAYSLPSFSLVQIALYDLSARRIQLVRNAPQKAGSHTLTLDLSNRPTGTYFLKLTQNQTTKTKKLLLMK